MRMIKIILPALLLVTFSAFSYQIAELISGVNSYFFVLINIVLYVAFSFFFVAFNNRNKEIKKLFKEKEFYIDVASTFGFLVLVLIIRMFLWGF